MRIIKKLKLKVNKVLYVGDRSDRDGICAERAGIDYLDVKEFMNN